MFDKTAKEALKGLGYAYNLHQSHGNRNAATGKRDEGRIRDRRIRRQEDSSTGGFDERTVRREEDSTRGGFATRGFAMNGIAMSGIDDSERRIQGGPGGLTSTIRSSPS